MIDRRDFLTSAFAASLAVVAAACSGSSSKERAATTRPRSPSTVPPTTATTTTPAPTTTTTDPGTPARFVERGTAASPPRVALTFHTGLGDPGLVLDLLHAGTAAAVPMNLMVIGQWLESNPTVATELVQGDHEIGNHTYSHRALLQLSPAQALIEIQRCADVLQRLVGTKGLWLRPSGTETSQTSAVVNAAAGQAGYPVVLGFDVDPTDNADPGAAAVQQRVLATMQPGSIVSLHSGHRGTIDALAPLAASIRARGYELVKVSDIVNPARP
ncbi:MAG: polysaccharide deacetylase [Actinomycetia bacterium]|nr:polysaccharide deacetylase [Actinomycetes bacterium]